MLAKYKVQVTDVVINPDQVGAPPNAIVPNNSAFHLLIRNLRASRVIPVRAG
jgi:hypothetical protein